MRIAVVALGKIGLPLAVQFATKGHEVIGCDVNQATVDLINQGFEPFPGETDLAKKLSQVVASGSLTATTDTTSAVAQAVSGTIIFSPVFYRSFNVFRIFHVRYSLLMQTKCIFAQNLPTALLD